DDVRFAGLVGRIGIGVARRTGDTHDGLLVPCVVIEHEVALLDPSQMLLRERIPDPGPHRSAVLRKGLEAVVRGFFLHQIVSHAERIAGSQTVYTDAPMVLSAADYAVIAAYLLAITLFGSWFARFQKTTTDYFLADQSVPWWAICFTVVATET